MMGSAFGRGGARRGRGLRVRLRAAALAVVLACAAALGLGLPGAAGADEVRALELAAPDAVQLARFDLVALPMSCSPAAVECGLPCGMEDMCGLDPCLCGPVDEFGACACNGVEAVVPTFALADDGGGRVSLVELFGAQYLVPLAPGAADVTVRASLPHHEDAVSVIHVEVAPLGVLDVVKAAGAVVVLGACAAGIVLGVRAAVRRLRARAARGATAGGDAV